MTEYAQALIIMNKSERSLNKTKLKKLGVSMQSIEILLEDKLISVYKERNGFYYPLTEKGKELVELMEGK